MAQGFFTTRNIDSEDEIARRKNFIAKMERKFESKLNAADIDDIDR